MEAGSCVKAVVVAANQYRNNPNEAHIVHLMRQLDVLITITGKGSIINFFDPKQLLPTECLACLVDILNDPQTKVSLAHKIMQLLSNLANESEIREALHNTFNLTSCLANFLKVAFSASSDPVAIKCVKLLQKVTYDSRINFQENYVEDLIKFVVKHVESKETELTQPCMGLLANLCRHNFSVQTHIKNMEGIRSFCKRLMLYFTHSSQTVVVFALSILTSLGLHEDFGQKMFNAQNINQTFQLMFNILVHSDTLTTLRYVVDLFTDLNRHAKIQNHLTQYDYLEPCMKQVVGLLCTKDTHRAAKIFELLLSFCNVNGLRCVICRALVESTALTDPAQVKAVLSHAQLTEPFLAVIHWAGQSVDSHDVAPLLAMDFLRELYQEIFDLNLISNVGPRSDIVLPMLTETLMAPINQPSGAPIRKRCRKVIKAIQLLNTLCSGESMKGQVAKCIDTKTCMDLINFQITNNHIGLSSHFTGTPDLDDWNESGVEVVLYTLDLMSKIKRYVANMETNFSSILQDSRLVPFLAFGITCESREIVQITLQLVGIGATLEEFPTILLGDSISASNASRSRQKEFQNMTPDESGPPTNKRPAWTLQDSNKENVPANQKRSKSGAGQGHSKMDQGTDELDFSVQSLIDKMSTGMELKDLRASEIINVYEHRLQSLQTKENHLQDLLEAKALALAQADRLISQYRCRRAQSEAEAHKLRSLLRESERRSEEHREQVNEMIIERERSNSEIDQLVQENTRLETVEDQHKELTAAFTEQTQRFESVQRSLSTLKQEHQTMSEMHEMLRRHNETLKQQHDLASQQLVELEDERKNLSRQLKEKETKLQELSKSLGKAEERLKKASKERDDLENAIDKLRDTLGRTEAAKKELQHQVNTLEVVCRQHEEAITEKETTLRAQKTELDKHAQIAALIHNLSSGKAPNP